MSLRTRVKRALERATVVSGVAGALRARRTGSMLVLGYHNVNPDGASAWGERALHLPLARFREHLDLLADACEVVPFASVLTETPAEGRPRVAITFDDAYSGAVSAGLDEVRARGMPATVFVAPAFVESQRGFWWDALAAAKGGVLEEGLRRTALETLGGRDDRVRRSLETVSEAEVPPYARAASEAELAEAVRAGEVALGSHSWSHPNLTGLEEPELVEELSRPLSWLRDRFDRVVPWLAYPYGASSGVVERAARAAGYGGGLRIEGGWIGRGGLRNPFAVPRLNVPAGLTADGLALRLAGLLCR